MDHLDSYLEALSEFHQEGCYLYRDSEKIRKNAAQFIADLRDDKSQNHRPYQDWVEYVPETILWMVKDGEYIGGVDIRHRLNWHLEKWGGHLGFTIRPSMRGRGYGKKLIQKAVPFMNYFGIEKALITLDPARKEAARIVEFCGGRFEDELPATGKFPARCRYWLDCT